MWFQKILSIWRSKRKDSDYKYTAIKKVQSFSEIPKKLGSIIYIVGSRESNKWVVFECPCGDSKRIKVNLMKSHYPNWKIKIKKKEVSLWPSIIAYHNKRVCHFWLKKNRIKWS